VRRVVELLWLHSLPHRPRTAAIPSWLGMLRRRGDVKHSSDGGRRYAVTLPAPPAALKLSA
jgi:hypothetical protein